VCNGNTHIPLNTDWVQLDLVSPFEADEQNDEKQTFPVLDTSGRVSDVEFDKDGHVVKIHKSTSDVKDDDFDMGMPSLTARL
jgi:hypothetical protein